MKSCTGATPGEKEAEENYPIPYKEMCLINRYIDCDKIKNV